MSYETPTKLPNPLLKQRRTTALIISLPNLTRTEVPTGIGRGTSMPSPEIDLSSIMPDTVISPLGPSHSICVRATYGIRGFLRLSLTYRCIACESAAF